MYERTVLHAAVILLGVSLLTPWTEGRDFAPAQKWAARYNGPGNAADRARAMAMDKSGNVYVTGESAGTRVDVDFATIKYSPAGKRLWVQRYDGLQSRDDNARAIAVDGSGNVFVTGIANRTDGDSIMTIKYNTNGKPLWSQRVDDQVSAIHQVGAIAVDGSGNAYVAGGTWNPGSATNCDGITIKYNPNGKRLWAKKFNGSANGWDSLNAISVDDSGNILVTGKSWTSGAGFDYVTVKYTTAGRQLWAKKYSGPGNGDDIARAIAVDKSGDVFITGESKGTDSDYDYATLKYSATGKEIWVRRYNGPANGGDWATALAVDGSGQAAITGKSERSKPEYDMATIAYDAGGKELWIQRYDGPGNAYDDAAAIDRDASGNIFITGTSTCRTADNSDKSYLTTIKYGSNGKPFWIKKYRWPGNAADHATGIAVDKSGNVYVIGESFGPSSNWDYITIKY